jgi:hypothetical protein
MKAHLPLLMIGKPRAISPPLALGIVAILLSVACPTHAQTGENRPTDRILLVPGTRGWTVVGQSQSGDTFAEDLGSMASCAISGNTVAYLTNDPSISGAAPKGKPAPYAYRVRSLSAPTQVSTIKIPSDLLPMTSICGDVGSYVTTDEKYLAFFRFDLKMEQTSVVVTDRSSGLSRVIPLPTPMRRHVPQFIGWQPGSSRMVALETVRGNIVIIDAEKGECEFRDASKQINNILESRRVNGGYTNYLLAYELNGMTLCFVYPSGGRWALELFEDGDGSIRVDCEKTRQVWWMTKLKKPESYSVLFVDHEGALCRVIEHGPLCCSSVK